MRIGFLKIIILRETIEFKWIAVCTYYVTS